MTNIKRFLLLDRTPAQTWDLFTNPAHLEKWFCDRAEVEAKPGGALYFAGKCVLGGETRTHFSRYEENENLAFPWQIFTAPTNVLCELGRQLDMTRLVVTHEAESTPDLAIVGSCGEKGTTVKNKIYLDDLWWNNLGRLKFYVETGKVPFKPDLSVEPSEKVVQSMLVDVPSDQAFAALTEGRHLDGWMGQNSKPNLTVGEKFEIGWNTGPGAVTEHKPGEKIAYDWSSENQPNTHVEWRVEKEGVRARITLTHSGFGGLPFEFQEYNRGWAGFMVRLALYLETGIPARDWSGAIPEERA